MTRILETVLATMLVLVALVAVPGVTAQGPPPGYTDPVAYAQDYAAAEAAGAQADPVGYAAGKDPATEAEHALWLACWTAYDQLGHALDPACAAFFTAPVQVNPAAQGAMAQVTQVLNDTGAAALADEALDAVNDTVADPASAADQALRLVHAVLRFVEDALDFVLDALGLAGLGVAAGLLGAAQGILDLLLLPLAGGRLALDGLAAALAGTASASASAAGAWLGAVHATLDAVASGASAMVEGLGAVAAGLAAAGRGAADGVQAVAAGVGQGLEAVGDAVKDGVRHLSAEVGSWFHGNGPGAAPEVGVEGDLPETGTAADGLLERLLGGL